MPINQELKADLATNLNVSTRRIEQRIQQRCRDLPMSRDSALHTIAQEAGIDLSKYLSGDELSEARKAISDWSSFQSTQANRSSIEKRVPRPVASTPKATTLRLAGVDASGVPGLTNRHINEAKEMADKVYPMLYLFENSVRSIIERVLSAQFGNNWWANSVPKKLREKAKDRMVQEKKNPWHGRRGADEIYYIDLNDLCSIIKNQWPYFKALFPNQPWIESLITNDMNISRRQVAHMNPIAKNDVKNVEAAFRKWTQQLQGVASLIP